MLRGRGRSAKALSAEGDGHRNLLATLPTRHFIPRRSGYSQALFDQLVEQRRQTFRRMHDAGMTYKEIGHWFGISKQAVQQSLRIYVKAGSP